MMAFVDSRVDSEEKDNETFLDSTCFADIFRDYSVPGARPARDQGRLQALDPKPTRPGVSAGQRTRLCPISHRGATGVFYVSPDTAHEFQSWRRSLREMAPLLFKD